MIGKNKKKVESIADFPTTYAQVYIKNYFTPISNNSAAISGLTIRIRLSFFYDLTGQCIYSIHID